MGKTRSQIIMDFRRAKEQASALERQANRMKSLVNEQFSSVMRNVERNWTGENADTYLLKCRTVSKKILQSASDLSQTAKTIRIIAKNTYDAEMEAWRIAHRRRQ